MMVLLTGLVPREAAGPRSLDSWRRGFLTGCVRGVWVAPSDDLLSQ